MGRCPGASTFIFLPSIPVSSSYLTQHRHNLSKEKLTTTMFQPIARLSVQILSHCQHCLTAWISRAAKTHKEGRPPQIKMRKLPISQWQWLKNKSLLSSHFRTEFETMVMGRLSWDCLIMHDLSPLTKFFLYFNLKCILLPWSCGWATGLIY